MIQEESAEQLIMMDEPQEVYSASTLAGEVRDALLKPGELHIDLQGAVRIHAAVLQVLIAAQRSCNGSGRAFTLSGAAPEIQALLEMAGLFDSKPA